ncbi:ATP-binding protein [Sulfobacillus harzensis]|uniref:ATP-binding protein n=1 Tax=Sulfobacillus harzensis TaxID=2729629 RepID=UPI003B82EB1F
MENALKYSDPVRGQIAMVLRWDVQSGYVGILVRNNGKGIPAYEMPLVFGRFYRGEEARVVEGGTGLGLSLAQSLMRAQHGTIGMTSADGTTEVTLWFRQLSSPESGRIFLQI